MSINKIGIIERKIAHISPGRGGCSPGTSSVQLYLFFYAERRKVMNEKIKYCFVEIQKLEKLLQDAEIPYRRTINPVPMCELITGKCMPARNQIEILYENCPIISCICQYGSYGARDGLIECYDFCHEPRGSLNAEEAFEWIKEWME